MAGKKSLKIMQDVFYVLIFLAVMNSCTPSADNTPETVIQKLLSSNRPLNYYSTKTRSLVSTLQSKGMVSNGAALLPLASQNIAVDIVNKKKHFRSVTLQVRFTRHPRENIIGTVIPVPFIVEQGTWVIDRSEMLEPFIDRGNKGVSDYIKKIVSQYR